MIWNDMICMNMIWYMDIYMHVHVWYGILQDAEMLTEVTAKLGDFGVAKVGSWSDIAELPKISWKKWRCFHSYREFGEVSMETTKMICLYLFKPFFNVSWIILKFSRESQPENTSSSDQVGSFGNADRSAAARRHLHQTQKLCRGSMFVRHSLSFHAWMWIPCSSTTCVRSRHRTSWHLK